MFNVYVTRQQLTKSCDRHVSVVQRISGKSSVNINGKSVCLFFKLLLFVSLHFTTLTSTLFNEIRLIRSIRETTRLSGSASVHRSSISRSWRGEHVRRCISIECSNQPLPPGMSCSSVARAWRFSRLLLPRSSCAFVKSGLMNTLVETYWPAEVHHGLALQIIHFTSSKDSNVSCKFSHFCVWFAKSSAVFNGQLQVNSR